MANNFDSKYKDMMSHISVDDEMRDRILKNVIKASENPAPIPAKKNRARIVPLISSVVAAAIALFFIGVTIYEYATGGYAPKSSDAEVVFDHNAEINNVVSEVDRDNSEETGDCTPEDITEDADEAETAEPEAFEYVISWLPDVPNYICSDPEGIESAFSLIEKAKGDLVSDVEQDEIEAVYVFAARRFGETYAIAITDEYILINDQCYINENTNLGRELYDLCLEYGG